MEKLGIQESTRYQHQIPQVLQIIQSEKTQDITGLADTQRSEEGKESSDEPLQARMVGKEVHEVWNESQKFMEGCSRSQRSE